MINFMATNKLFHYEKYVFIILTCASVVLVEVVYQQDTLKDLLYGSCASFS